LLWERPHSSRTTHSLFSAGLPWALTGTARKAGGRVGTFRSLCNSFLCGFGLGDRSGLELRYKSPPHDASRDNRRPRRAKLRAFVTSKGQSFTPAMGTTSQDDFFDQNIRGQKPNDKLDPNTGSGSRPARPSGHSTAQAWMLTAQVSAGFGRAFSGPRSARPPRRVPRCRAQHTARPTCRGATSP
jgi:hypothetical protein